MCLNRMVIGDIVVIFPPQKEIVELLSIKYDTVKHIIHKTRQNQGLDFMDLTGYMDTMSPLNLGSLSFMRIGKKNKTKVSTPCPAHQEG